MGPITTFFPVSVVLPMVLHLQQSRSCLSTTLSPKIEESVSLTLASNGWYKIGSPSNAQSLHQ